MNDPNALSRRKVLGGMVLASVVPLIGAKAVAASRELPAAPNAVARPYGASAQPLQRFNASAVTLADGRVLVSGGYTVSPDVFADAMPTSSVQIFDPRSETWMDAAPMISPRAYHASVVLAGGLVAVLGGYCVQSLDSTELYNPMTDTWDLGSGLPFPIHGHTACATGGVVILSGGATGLSAHTVSVESSTGVSRA